MPWRRLIWRMAPVTLTYFCYGWSLWLFLNWLPTFFKESQHIDLKKSALYSSGVFFAGVVGDTLGGVLSDHMLRKTGRVTFSRLVIIVPSMLCAAGCLIPVLFVVVEKLTGGDKHGKPPGDAPAPAAGHTGGH